MCYNMDMTDSKYDEVMKVLSELQDMQHDGEWVVVLDPKKFDSYEDMCMYAYYLEHFDEMNKEAE